MVENEDQSIFPADPANLAYQAAWIRSYGENVRNRDTVERGVLESHGFGIHCFQMNSVILEPFGTATSDRQHVLANIDSHDLAGAWVPIEGEARTHADFQNALRRGCRDRVRQRAAARFEHCAEQLVVHRRISTIGVDDRLEGEDGLPVILASARQVLGTDEVRYLYRSRGGLAPGRALRVPPKSLRGIAHCLHVPSIRPLVADSSRSSRPAAPEASGASRAHLEVGRFLERGVDYRHKHKLGQPLHRFEFESGAATIPATHHQRTRDVRIVMPSPVAQD